MFKIASLLSAALLAVSVVEAQQGEWQQCGGIGWTGGTTCQSPWVCTKLNDWYFQCLPGSSSSSSSSTRTSSTSSTRSTSTSSTRSTSTSSTRSTSSSTRSTSGGTTNPTSCSGNPYSGMDVWRSTYYASEVYAAAAQVTDSALKAKISKVADIPTFTWFDTMAKVADLPGYLSAASGKILQIVVYDLPNRDCHANASNGELTYANNGAALYQQYIDGMVSAISAASTRVVAVVEPDSLANLVTNLSDQRCSSVQTQYKASVTYALQKLSTVGVYLYMDAGHAGWLGWTSNLSPAAQLFAQMYTSGGKSSCIRGLATNVANYNALTTNSPDPITQGDPNYDELLYIQALAPQLSSNGWSGAHFIVDQGRSGVQNIRNQWGDWCNIKGAGFGIHPTTSTPDPLIDAIVWVKPGGECDGTSDTSSPRFDSTCALSDAKQPAPEAGTWFQAYFIDLVNNANPAL